jgi:diacylglycerol kinase family enzyme
VGGDGTVQLVAPHLKGKPFSSFHLGPPKTSLSAYIRHQILSCWRLTWIKPKYAILDLGTLMHRSGSKSFLEAIGMGVFAELILEMQKWPRHAEMERAASRKEKFAHALRQLQAISPGYEGLVWELKADGTTLTDRFILIAVMNMELVGPSLRLAPGADPSDGYLDLVCVRERHRENLCRSLEGQLPGHKNDAHFESE